MITANNQNDTNELGMKDFFSDKDAAGFYEWHDWSTEQGLERLIFRVSRSPRYLQAHLERIYYCFQHDLKEQLFGSLVDLLIVLNKDGKALGRRMIRGSRSKLTENQFLMLGDQLNNISSGRELFPDSRYSVFSKGLQSVAVLVQA
jgi:hypothetical protein